ncbi:10756_t:CDS:2, partial [Racocetra fulgida]
MFNYFTYFRKIETLNKFLYKIIFYKTPEKSPIDINVQEQYIICQDKICPNLQKSIVICFINLTDTHCPICRAEFNEDLENTSFITNNFQKINPESLTRSTTPIPSISATSIVTVSTTTTIESARLRKLQKARGILRELLTINNNTEMMDISFDEEQNNENINGPSLAYLYVSACRTKESTIKNTQVEILSWYKFAEKFDNRVKEILANQRIAIKTAKTEAYKEILKRLPGIKLETLRKRTQKANTIYTLFKYVGIDKIDRIRSYSANEISNL